jgi:hypothetical protein
VTLKGLHYTVGLAHAGKDIRVRFDASIEEWIFLELDSQERPHEIRRQSLHRIDFTVLTGLPKSEKLHSLPPIQLTLPLAV